MNRDEQALQIAIVKMIRYRKMPGVVFWHTPNEGKRSMVGNAIMLAMGLLPGMSDLAFLIPPAARGAVLELKKPGEEPTADQRTVMDAVTAIGGYADWCDNIDDAERILLKWRVIR